MRKSIPRNVWRDVVANPKYSLLENGTLNLTSAINKIGVTAHEHWSGPDIDTQIAAMATYYDYGAGGTYDTEKILGCIFKETIEYLITNWSNVPTRLWILEFEYKKTARYIDNAANTPISVSFTNLWDLGFTKDIDGAALEVGNTVYGYTYGRSEPFKQYIRVLRRHEVILMPGQTHTHSVTWDMNKFVNMQRISSASDWNENGTRHGGFTHGTAFIQHGTVGETVVSTVSTPGLMPTELGVVYRRSWQGTLLDRYYGKTEVPSTLNVLATLGTADQVVNPVSGVGEPVEEVNA